MIDEFEVYDYGLIVPEGTTIASMSPEVQAIVAEYKAEFPAARVYGTVPDKGQQVVYVRMQKKLSKADLEALFTQFNLNWQVIGIRSAYKILEVVKGEDQFGNLLVSIEYDEVLPVDKAAVVPFVPNATIETPLTVPVYAGTDPIKL